jgi:hypothetical protein
MELAPDSVPTEILHGAIAGCVGNVMDHFSDFCIRNTGLADGCVVSVSVGWWDAAGAEAGAEDSSSQCGG